MDALKDRQSWAALPPAQLPAKALQAFTIIAERAPQPVTWQALALRIWPDDDAAAKRKEPNVQNLISLIRGALGRQSLIGSIGDGWTLGSPEWRPVPTTANRTLRHEPLDGAFVPACKPAPDTASELLRAQEWAQSQRPSAPLPIESFVKSRGISS